MIPPRMTKNPARPIRHRAGKATATSSDSDSDSDDNQPQQISKPTPIPAPRPTAGKVLTNIGQFASSDRQEAAESSQSRQRPSAQELKKLAAEQGFVTEEENEEDDDDSDDDDSDDESSKGSSSEDDAPRRLMLRPKFIPKAQRQAAAAKNNASEASVAAVELEEKRLLEEEMCKKAEADRLVEEQIKKDLAARAMKKKHWDDNEDDEDNVDDTDDINPEAELAAFKLRKLKRYKRDREAMISREKELEEIERRRNLTEEERKKEDNEFLTKQQTKQESKGQMAYMQKYHHKGAFYQEQAEAAGLTNRDIMGAKFADEIKDRSILPEYLQRRDMTKLGRKGATKYKDMKSENSGRWGDVTERRPGEGNCDTNWRQRGSFHGIDDRFKPDDDFRSGKGANSVPLGTRSDRQDYRRGDSRSFNRENGDSYKGRDRGGKKRERRSRSYEEVDRDRRDRHRWSSRDRSMSPRYRRKRSPSRDDRDRSSDKRRRVHL